MKEFNLEESKAGKAVCTKDGRPARIVCWDARDSFPIVALVTDHSGRELVQTYKEDGRLHSGNISCNDDLMMTAVKKEGWGNMHRTENGLFIGTVHPTKEKAEENRIVNSNFVCTTKITWEE